jgi:hypothetical protein
VENSQWAIGVDLNGDNYINDPVGDDWSLTNLNGTEDNGSWDSSEPYKDWGTDGLPASLAGDIDDNGTEGNGSYDLGEPFDDTGNDGVFNENEFGYNVVGTEGNNAFDGEGEFLDCGEDNICNDAEGDDDYNIDPNGDNWSATDSTSIGTEGNDLLHSNYLHLGQYYNHHRLLHHCRYYLHHNLKILLHHQRHYFLPYQQHYNQIHFH